MAVQSRSNEGSAKRSLSLSPMQPAYWLAQVSQTLLDLQDNPWGPHWPWPKQAAFLSLPHREALYGGAAGGGKSDALLMAAAQRLQGPRHPSLRPPKSH